MSMHQCNYQSVLTTTFSFRIQQALLEGHRPHPLLLPSLSSQNKLQRLSLGSERMHKLLDLLCYPGAPLWQAHASPGKGAAKVSKKRLRSGHCDKESQVDRKNIVEGCASLTPVFISSSCIYKAQGGVSVMLQEHKSIVCIFKENRVELGNTVYREGLWCTIALQNIACIMYIGTGNNLEASLWLFMNSAWNLIICCMHWVHTVC